MKTRFLPVGAAVLIILFAACGPAGKRETPPLPVTVMVATPDVISRIVMAPCRIEAEQEAIVTVSSPVRIEEVMVVEGDSVLQDDVLVRLATDDMYSSSVNSAASMIGAALSTAEYSESNLARAENLFLSGALSPSEYEAVVTAAESARAALSSARAGYQQATAVGSSGQVTAPFDGRVTRVWAKIGNRASGPIIAIAGDGVLKAELLLSERHLPWIRGLAGILYYCTLHRRDIPWQRGLRLWIR
jgi:RND family efflux transporter MFP subunit